MWLRCRNMCTQTPCRLWQVEHCLHSRLFPILRFSWPNPILILIPDYSQTTPILRFSDSSQTSISDDSQSNITPTLQPTLRLLPGYSLFSNYSQITPYAQIISRLLPMLKLFPDYSSPHAQIISRLLPDFPNLRLLQD